MTEQVTLQPSSDERMLAALAHFFGLLGALIIWAMQKDKSRFVRFQAAQALAFDFLVTLLMGIVFFCFFGVMFLGMAGSMFTAMNSGPAPESFNRFMVLPFVFPTLVFTCIFPFSFGFLIARVVAAVSVLSGHDFHYPFLGKRVETFLND
jgi:uncharacterized Tic20 family protein